MRKISFSTWLLVGLAALVVALAAALFILTPPEKWTELRNLHDRHFYALAQGGPAAGDLGGAYVRPGFPFRRPHGHPPFLGFLTVILVCLIAGRFLLPRRRADASLPILEELFAEGKIDEAEFKRRKTVLNESRGKEE